MFPVLMLYSGVLYCTYARHQPVSRRSLARRPSTMMSIQIFERRYLTHHVTMDVWSSSGRTLINSSLITGVSNHHDDCPEENETSIFHVISPPKNQICTIPQKHKSHYRVFGKIHGRPWYLIHGWCSMGFSSLRLWWHGLMMPHPQPCPQIISGFASSYTQDAALVSRRSDCRKASWRNGTSWMEYATCSKRAWPRSKWKTWWRWWR